MGLSESNEPFLRSRRSRVLCYVVIGVVSLAVTGPSLLYDFVQDDHLLVVDNPTITSWGNLAHILTSDYFARMGSYDRVGYYRPLTNLSYMVDHSLWGLSPICFHLTNVVLGTVTALLAFRLALLLLPLRFALITALFFSLHPGRVQAVGMITARSDLIAALFSFWLLGNWLNGPHERGPGRSAWILLFCALLGKEASIAVAAVLGLWSLIQMDGAPSRKRLSTWLALVLPIAAYLVIRALLEITPLPIRDQSLAELLGAAGRVFGFYLRTLFVPLDTATAPQLPLPSLGWSLMLLTFIPLLVPPFLCLRKDPAIGAGTSWVALSVVVLLLPHAIRNPTIDDYLAPSPRFLYLPAIGVALFWGGVLYAATKKYPKLGRITLLVGVLWSVLLASEFLSRLAEFENDVATDRAAIRDLSRIPEENRSSQYQASLLLSQGMVLRAEERLEEAAAALEEASLLDPRSLRIRVLFASLLHDTDQDSLAKTILRDILDPRRISRWSHTELSIYYMTGIVLFSDILTSQGETYEALSWLRLLIQRFPASWKAHSKLAIVQAQAGDSTAARESFQRALMLAPHGRWEQEIRERMRTISR